MSRNHLSRIVVKNIAKYMKSRLVKLKVAEVTKITERIKKMWQLSMKQKNCRSTFFRFPV